MFLLISLFNSTFFTFLSSYFSLYFSSFPLILILTLFSTVISVCFFFSVISAASLIIVTNFLFLFSLLFILFHKFGDILSDLIRMYLLQNHFVQCCFQVQFLYATILLLLLILTLFMTVNL